jgi:uncharacterized protein (DUF1800 family)
MVVARAHGISVDRAGGHMGDPVASRADVARLFARAAFGATAAQLDQWTGQPYASIVDHLLTTPDRTTTQLRVDDVTRVAAELGQNVPLAQSWWLGRMQTTAWPLEERMVLFWHDHWATSVTPDGPSITLVMQQNEILRRHALGNFRAMCEALTIDAAMLAWLDGNVNKVGAPNENYAREFFELFTLGTTPQVYTETDIREAARAYTGWRSDNRLGVPSFQPAQHDKGTKTILGTTVNDLGAEEYKAVVSIALQQPVAPKFVAYKLVQNFAYLPATRDLFASPDPLVDAIASTLVATNWDLRAAVRTMLLADEFRYASPAAGDQVVRPPVDLAVHGAKAAGVAADDPALPKALKATGQSLFEPPNVGGWPVARNWLSTTTAIARYDLAIRLTTIRNQTLETLRPPLPPSSDVVTGAWAWTAHMGLAQLAPSTLSALQSYVASRAGAAEIELQNGIFALLASSPDWEVV